MSRSLKRAPGALAALALLASPAAADAGFTPGAPVAAGDALLDLAVGPDGTTAALWTDGSDLVAGVKARGGDWDVATLGTADDGSIAVGPDGSVVVAYFDADLRARVRPPGGAFGASETLGVPDAAVDAAFRADGTPIVAWRDGADIVVRERTTAWSADLATTDALTAADDVVLATGPGNRVAVVYPDVETATDRVVAATGPGFAQTDSFAGSSAAVDAAYRADGQLDLTWRTPGGAIASAKVAANGDPSDHAVGLGDTDPAVARGVAAWASGGAVHAARATGTGLLSDTLGVLASGASAAPGAGALPGGRALVAWPAGDELPYRILNHQNVSGVAPVDLDGAAPKLATDPAASVGALAWAAGGSIHASVYDDAAPVLSALSVPGTAITGAPIALGAAVTDAETGPPSVTWDLGDGRVVEGATPAPIAYATPGPRLVTVTATDAGGNTATASATITVVSPPPPPPGVFGFDVLRDRQAPALRSLRLTRRSFRIDGGQTAMAAGARDRPGDRGTEIQWTLDEPATVYIGVEKLGKGWRGSGNVCALKRRTKSAKGCTRLVVMGQLTRRGKTGKNGMRFTGRFGRHALSPGKYRFAVFARDAAGNTSLVKRVAFTMRP